LLLIGDQFPFFKIANVRAYATGASPLACFMCDLTGRSLPVHVLG
jgi:hypothetical protein